MVSLFATLFVLEVGARLFFAPPAPVLDRGGTYRNALRLVNRTYGGTNLPMDLDLEATALDRQKRPGERRVFVFGESSVEGLPWGAAGSPAGMLLRQLAEEEPDADLTVVNMGRSAATTLDTYYYLLSIRPYEPDYVVFFQGTNDFVVSVADSEWCAPVKHAALHSLWRWGATHSAALWNLRVRGPHLLGTATSMDAQDAEAAAALKDACVPAEAFRRWTDILVEAASDTGAEVIVTLPVASVHQDVDDYRKRELAGGERASAEERIAALDAEHRALLWSRLAQDGSFGERLKRFLAARRSGAGAPFEPEPLGDIRAAWVASAERFGATVVDPRPAFVAASPDGLLGPPLIIDRVHPSLDGNWTIAQLWRAVIQAHRTGSSPPAAAEAGRDARREHWRRRFAFATRSIEEHAEELLTKGDLLVAVDLLEHAAGFFGSPTARERLDEIRRAVSDGLAPLLGGASGPPGAPRLGQLHLTARP